MQPVHFQSSPVPRSTNLSVQFFPTKEKVYELNTFVLLTLFDLSVIRTFNSMRNITLSAQFSIMVCFLISCCENPARSICVNLKKERKNRSLFKAPLDFNEIAASEGIQRGQRD